MHSHYDYLNLFLEDLWQKEFGKTLEQMWCSGFPTAHGDKCEQYKEIWEENNIPFERGAALYMLTFTKSMDRPKPESCKFVIEKYPLYKDFFEAIEKDFITKYNTKKKNIIKKI